MLSSRAGILAEAISIKHSIQVSHSKNIRLSESGRLIKNNDMLNTVFFSHYNILQ